MLNFLLVFLFLINLALLAHQNFFQISGLWTNLQGQPILWSLTVDSPITGELHNHVVSEK